MGLNSGLVSEAISPKFGIVSEQNRLRAHLSVSPQQGHGTVRITRDTLPNFRLASVRKVRDDENGWKFWKERE